MAKRKCPMCAESIQAKALRCRHCGADVVPAEKPKSRLGCLLAVLVVPVLVILLVVVNSDPRAAHVAPASQAPVKLPSYTVLDRTDLLAGGGAHVDVLLARSHRKASDAELESIARGIATKESATQVSLYCTKAARKAAYSAKYARRHRKAVRCQLGALIDGRFRGP